GVIWLLSVAGWVALGGVTQSRGSAQKSSLREKVNELWGPEQVQHAPVVSFRRELPPPEPEANEPKAKPEPKPKPVPPSYEQESVKATLASTRIDASLHSDPRRKGLVWYALYDVGFAATYS